MSDRWYQVNGMGRVVRIFRPYIDTEEYAHDIIPYNPDRVPIAGLYGPSQDRSPLTLWGHDSVRGNCPRTRQIFRPCVSKMP